MRYFMGLSLSLGLGAIGVFFLVAAGLPAGTVVAATFAGVVIAGLVALLIARSGYQEALQRTTRPVTPSHVPSVSSYPRTRSGFVGGGISTSVSFSNPKRL